MDFNRTSSVTAIVSAIIAILALTFQVYQQREESIAKEIREWQKTAVYELFITSRKPMNYEQIYSKYLDEVININVQRNIAPSKKTKLELRRILLELLEKRIIGYAQRIYYLEEIAPPDVSNALLRRKIARELNRIEPIALRMIRSNDGLLTEHALFQRIKDTQNTFLRPDDFYRIIRQLTIEGIITINHDGTINRVLQKKKKQIN